MNTLPFLLVGQALAAEPVQDVTPLSVAELGYEQRLEMAAEVSTLLLVEGGFLAIACDEDLVVENPERGVFFPRLEYSELPSTDWTLQYQVTGMGMDSQSDAVLGFRSKGPARRCFASALALLPELVSHSSHYSYACSPTLVELQAARERGWLTPVRRYLIPKLECTVRPLSTSI